MARSIEEIQKDLQKSYLNIRAIKTQEENINSSLEAFDEQEQKIAMMALTPTQIENRKLLTEIQGSVTSMEREIVQSATDLKNAYESLSEIDVKDMNMSVKSINEVLKLADPERRSELIEALDMAYYERKRTLERSYDEQKKTYDELIQIKKNELKLQESKVKEIKIKIIIINTLIAMAIIFVLAFAVRWGTILRNKISDKNNVVIDWLLPSGDV